MGMVLSRTESFSVTEAGGNFISAVDPNVSLSIPTKAISGTLHASLKVIIVYTKTIVLVWNQGRQRGQSYNMKTHVGRAGSYVRTSPIPL